jgi:hypothetical protein
MKDIDEIKAEIERLEARKIELENNENTDEYDDMLDDSYGEVDICGMKYQSSRVLKELDPTAYQCGMNDYNDSAITEINEEIEQLEADIKDAEAAEAEENEAAK